MSDASVRPFAVFDIDGTLIRWQLFHAIVHQLGKHGYIPADAHERIMRARGGWKVRKLPEGFAQYEHVLVEEYFAALKQIDAEQYMAIVQEVFDEYKDQTFTYTRNLMHELKDKGYMLLAISGSQQDIVDKLALHHEFDVAVGATFEKIDGKFTGIVDSPVLDKAKALRRLIEEYSLSTKDSVGVGDSTSDIPMLELVNNPIVFNPDKKLFAAASERQWKIVVERKNMVFELEPHDGQYKLKHY